MHRVQIYQLKQRQYANFEKRIPTRKTVLTAIEIIHPNLYHYFFVNNQSITTLLNFSLPLLYLTFYGINLANCLHMCVHGGNIGNERIMPTSNPNPDVKICLPFSLVSRTSICFPSKDNSQTVNT